ncbi:head-tail adaptor protein [Halomonas sp. SL1]|uniref:head-tail adaptor protein n=1 Tax=Halomonas sp. SL1 TaxID=2137478 RepID=UPI000D159F55|nr:head-tail adaptor protein [Halomonas sp. SL1]RAH37414.1 head-tail adaptor protein [Halomonas sp. SL1]
MRAGKLRDRVTLRGARHGHPPAWPDAGQAWAEFVEPRSAGRTEQQGIRAPASTLVRMRPRPGLVPGMLIERPDGALFIIEAIDPARTMVEIAARRLQGVPAQYVPFATGIGYSIDAWLVRNNVFVGEANEPRHLVEVIQPQLAWPWCERGDLIQIAGLSLEIVGQVEGTDDGLTVQLFTIPG